MSAVPHEGHAINQLIQMREIANGISAGFIEQYGGAVIGDLQFGDDGAYIPVTGLLDDIEMAKMHVFENRHVENVF